MRTFFLIIITVISLSVPFSKAFPESDTSAMTTDLFLATAENDSRLEIRRELVKYLENAPKGTPYIEKIEFRTQTEEFDITKQKYSLRFYPKAMGETECSRKLSGTAIKAAKAEHEAFLNTTLVQRYELILDYLETSSFLRLQKKLLAVCDDRITVLKKLSMSNLSFDINTLITAEDRYTELQLNIAELENRMVSVIRKIKTAAGSDARIAFDENRIIKVEIIEKMISSSEYVPVPGNIRLNSQKLKTELAKNQYDLEKTKDRDFLSFVGLEYDTDEYDDLEKSFSFKLAFNLPGISPNRDEITLRKQGWMEEKIKYEDEKRAISEGISALSGYLKQLIRQHNILVNRNKESNAEVSFRKYMEMEGIDPLILLKIKESILKNDVRTNRINYLILRQYIELMNITGRLSEKPLKNYISSTGFNRNAVRLSDLKIHK
ncbi:MAG: hypothetical protein GY795_23955 [Desulfobacterales bacterium]|nr:hypothetical protein [Desulfobacterales bacterium]